ncbi:multidrug effflux MFS transporter [Cupriavidus sp. UGS-1]|uniref:multidrug effflux MFS transporter n=1 Tax=Cupriavidus sp. UGS-1 TaxID=2899826 RepID=UPI001E2C7B5A|nr:multidrug effflux MFS transporter [Cupriavidus sp. UGS-1]MCD9120608.1 multidrug effflux MFS transporter [Cupriavidus sp. UGS-1]
MQSSQQAIPPSVRAPMWLLVLVTLSGTMAMHIFVPALPLAGADLHASTAGMQQTITYYVLGLAFGQLIYGPVSDTIGRRPTLLIGLALYLCASILALFATSLTWLLFARMAQALGGAAGITLGRSIVRDTAAPDRVTSELALLNLLTLVGPGLSPVVGSFLADQFGWRAIYVFLVAIAGVMVYCAWRLLPETNPERRSLQVLTIARDYRRLLRNRRYLGFMVGGSCSTTALYPYLATSPYIVHDQLGLPVWQIGWFATVTIVGASVGTMITKRLAGQLRPEVFLNAGAGLSLSMASALLLVQLGGWLTAPLLIAITFMLTVGAGLASPAALSRSISAVPGLTGAAAGLYGCGQMAIGALGTRLVGFGSTPATACAIVQIAITGAALCAYRVAARADTD